MKVERARLDTFTAGWPEDVCVSKEAIARAGFYWVGPGDRVRCVFCKNILRMWEDGDIPEAEHCKYFPRCPFVLTPLSCGNVPIETDDNNRLEEPSIVRRDHSPPPDSLDHDHQSVMQDQDQSGACATSKPPVCDTPGQFLMQENISLTYKLLCMMCKTRAKSNLLLPCRHLVACDECMPHLDACPACNGGFSKIQKVHRC